MSELIIKTQKENDVLKVFAEGRIDTTTSPQFESEVKASLGGAANVVIDFEKVNYISSAGLRVLLGIHKNVSENGGELIIKKPQDTVLEVFEVTGFSDMLNIEK